MKNSVPERHLYVNDSDGDDDGVSEDNGLEDGRKADDESDGSESSCGSPRRSVPNSYTTSWPQSYRQSIDIYSSVTPPTIGFLGTPTLNRLSGSFLTTSFRGKHPPEIISSLIKPLVPSPLAPERRSSQALIPSTHSKHTAVKSYQELPPPSSDCSYGQAVLNGMNVLCGVGILSTPYAVKEGGWIGLLVLFLFAVLSSYTGILLRRCLDSEPGLETYPDVGQAAFGRIGRIFISVVLYVELFGCCVEYIILESDNLSSLFPHAHLNLGGFYLSPKIVFALLTTLIVLPTTWLRDLSVLSYISAGGVVASILVVICLFWVGVVDKVPMNAGGSLIDFRGFPIALGLYGYCFSGHAVFPNIYSSLKNPNHYSAVVFTSFGICSVMFAAVAVVGYLLFGESTESQFTLNLPRDLVASNIAVWTTVVNPISKYALTLTPLALSLEELLPSRRLKTFAYPIMIRSALVLASLIVALSVPFFGLVMSLIGALLTMLVTLILPCACFLSIVKGRVSLIEGAFCVLIIIVGLVASSFGTFSAVARIIQSLQA